MNNIQTNQEHRYVELADSKGRKFKIDIDDYDRVIKHKWQVRTRKVYPNSKSGISEYISVYGAIKINGKFKHIALGRFILNALDKTDKVVDHIDRNTLDNRKQNLRIVSKSENGRNRKAVGYSKYLGVSFNKKKNNWISQICINYKNIRIGTFLSEIDAAKAYNKYCIDNKISCARLNHV